jgi:hypothetical protein
VELTLRDDDLPVRHMLRSAGAEAQRLLELPGDVGAANLIEVLDRITAVAALGLDWRRSGMTEMGIQALLDVYGCAVADLSVHESPHRLVPVSWLRVAERLYSLGALAVRLHDWATVRTLAVAPVPALEREQRHWSWHRDAVTRDFCVQLLTDHRSDETRKSPLLLSARAAAAADPLLRPDLPDKVFPKCTSHDPLWDSLCQFDSIATVVIGVAPDAEDLARDEVLSSRAHSDRANFISQ